MTPPLPEPEYYGYLFSDKQMTEYGNACIAQERERCAKIVEQDLYPDSFIKPLTEYQIQYNDGIARTAEKIRSGT